MSFSEINFLDLYVDLEDIHPPRMRPIYLNGDKQSLVFVPFEYHDDIKEFVKVIASSNNDSWSLEHDGVKVHVRKYQTASGETWASVKRSPNRVPRMEELGFPKNIRNRIKFFAKNSGLILFAGIKGAGKTTAANSVLEYYLRLYGDTAITVEQPIEYDFAGKKWGNNSSCYQYEVYDEPDWEYYIDKGMELQPRYIMVGEMMTPKCAAKALEVAASGNLVISTVEANSIEHALIRTRDLASGVLSEDADQLLAESLLSCVHQELGRGGLDMEILFAEGKGMGDPVRSLINAGRYSLLNKIIEHQNPKD